MKFKILLTTATLFTASYIFAGAYFLNEQKLSACELKLNEWGDLLAGLFAPLAFLWFIMSYILQGKELKESSDALKGQLDQQIVSSKLAAYTALLAHETKEHALFSTFGPEYIKAAQNARDREKGYKQKIDTLLSELEEVQG